MTLATIEARYAERDAKILSIRKQARIDQQAQTEIIKVAEREINRLCWAAQHAEDAVLKDFQG